MDVINTTSNVTSPVFSLNVYYWEQILIAILLGLVAITGLVGNAMIITAVAFSKKLQTSTNVFVTNLSVADLLSSISLIWYIVGNLGKREWPIPGAYWICQANGFMIYTFIGTSMWNLGAIAINRLIYITKPVLYKKIFTKWIIFVLVVITWVIPAAALLTPFATNDVVFGYDKDKLVCSSIADTDEFKYAQVAVGLLLPLPTIFTGYLLIYLHVKNHFAGQKKRLSNLSTVTAMETSSSGREIVHMESAAAGNDANMGPNARKPVRREKQIYRQEINITKNLFTVVVAFLGCFLPYFIAQPIRSRTNIEHIYFYIKIIPLCNSAINFMIYASKHPDFKVVLRHMMMCSYADIPQPSPFLKYLLSRKN